MEKRMKVKLNMLLFALAIPFFLSACGWEIVDTGHRGIEVKFGEIVGKPLPEGLHFYNPFTSSIVEIDVRERKMTKTTTAFTKDVQQADVTYSVNYKPDESTIHTLYQEVGINWDEILLPQVTEGNLKNAIGQWDAVKLVENRNLAVRTAEQGIKEVAMTRKIIVTRLEVTDIGFKDEFEKATEEKVVAQQKAEKAKNDTVRIEEEAKQKLITAKVDAESIKIKTAALEKSPALVQYEAVQKWNGVMPQYMLGGNTMPFLPVK